MRKSIILLSSLVLIGFQSLAFTNTLTIKLKYSKGDLGNTLKVGRCNTSQCQHNKEHIINLNPTAFVKIFTVKSGSFKPIKGSFKISHFQGGKTDHCMVNFKVPVAFKGNKSSVGECNGNLNCSIKNVNGSFASPYVSKLTCSTFVHPPK